ncbi:ets DNA-binding protein pokkuri [Anastrepha ludens]|uniref:ets DNA-binding protein pokkuri n=1 Tax=Anastrepha ludens TaxID=28586 RepID=UPI0023AEA653|nr:ets DNA-binding protein pokkuri [Anastrepha ludens]XP_053960888.1 ets DNA-binding protein pokkuri [Anastrepha ludens]XP_053960889.1 ets DNA-binding protein pokkuri [Anastrepha ludens]
MKMLPVQLSLNPPLGLWSDMLWRCPPAPSSQLAELKTQLPPSLPSDPRLWGREDVTVFLRFCEREFDLPKVEHDLFQMNGKALCLLTRADFGHRCPGAGDVLHNVLQMLIIESHMMQWHLPNSPVTPTSRYPLSPHSHPPTPTWPPIGALPDSPFHNAHMHHFMAPNSVTLSPPPSVDSQASSPPQSQEQNIAAAAAAAAASVSGASTSSSSSSSTSSGSSNSGGGLGANSNNAIHTNGSLVPPAISVTMSSGNSYSAHHATVSTGASSNQSDSDEEGSYSELAAAGNSLAKSGAAAAVVAAHYKASPPTTPILKDMPQSLSQQITNSFVNSWSQSQAAQAMGQKYQPNSGNGGSVSAPTTPSYMQPVKREFFPETTEPNTNGRLLWDFLQQLLNDRNQKYSDLIAWKCRDTGVFKIVDPAGLAKLWGIQKNHLSMNYDKMSRALRYYYRVNILRKVQGERHCYQFLRNPTELKNIKNISLLRQSVAGNGGPTATSSANGSNNAGSASNNNNSNNLNNGNNNNNNQSPGTNLSSTNWTLPHQQSPQRHPSSHASNGSVNGNSHSNGVGNQHMSLPAAVAAAAAAAYGPPPTSPLFMHAINGAFQYLSNNTGAPPNSPAMPHTPSEKFQFGALKVEHNSASSPDHGEELKPTDLSVAGSSIEKRPYSSPSAEDCYPLIRNADGLTTIKLIRYNNDNETNVSKQSTHEQQQQQQQQQQANAAVNCSNSGEQQQHTPMDHMDNDGNEDEAASGAAGVNLMPTDLRK